MTFPDMKKARDPPESRASCQQPFSSRSVSAPSSSTPIIPTIRSRSSTVANSIVILPLFRPMSTFTRVSKRSDSRSARSFRAGACTLARRAGADFFAGPSAIASDTSSSVARTERPSATIRSASCSWVSPSPDQQRSGVTRRQHARGHPALDRRRQVQQPYRVRDLRPAPADASRQFLVRRAELLEQLLVRRRLFQRVEVRPVDVLEQRVAQHRIVAGVADDRRDRFLADRLRRTPAALTHDQLVPAVAEVAYDDRLEEADLLDRGLQLLERFLVEDVPRLLRRSARSR